MGQLRRVIIPLLSGLGLTLALIGCQIGRELLITDREPAITHLEPAVLTKIPFTAGHPEEMVFQPQNEAMYITNKFSHVGIIKDAEEIGVLPTGRGPIALAADKESGWVYVTNAYSDTVTVIHGTDVITTIETAGREPMDVAVEPGSGWAYVVSPYKKYPPWGEIPVVEGNITVIRGTEIVGVVYFDDFAATRLVADPISGYVYVGGSIPSSAENASDGVVVLKEMQVIARFEVGLGIDAMDADPNTGDVYVLNDTTDRNLTQFREGKFIAKLKIRSEDPNDNSALRNMKVHPVTGDVYVVDFIKHEVVVVRDMEIIDRVPVGWGALKMTIDPLTENVYVANFQDDTVTVIHGTEVITTLKTGWYPYGIGVNPVNGQVYVSNTNDDTITILGVE